MTFVGKHLDKELIIWREKMLDEPYIGLKKIYKSKTKRL